MYYMEVWILLGEGTVLGGERYSSFVKCREYEPSVPARQLVQLKWHLICEYLIQHEEHCLVTVWLCSCSVAFCQIILTSCYLFFTHCALVLFIRQQEKHPAHIHEVCSDVLLQLSVWNDLHMPQLMPEL